MPGSALASRTVGAPHDSQRVRGRDAMPTRPTGLGAGNASTFIPHTLCLRFRRRNMNPAIFFPRLPYQRRRVAPNYQLCQTPEGLRLVGRGASYALTAMLSDAGWRIVGIRSESAKRLLKVAGLLTDSDAILPRRTRWRTSLGRPSERR